jgi:hypothetical protein
MVKVSERAFRFAVSVVCCLAIMLTAVVGRAEGVTLPSVGVDVGAFVTATITALGAVIAIVIGGYFAFLLVKKAVAWGRKAFG